MNEITLWGVTDAQLITKLGEAIGNGSNAPITCRLTDVCLDDMIKWLEAHP